MPVRITLAAERNPLLKHEPDDRFGGIDNVGFLIYPNAYDCYACHYGVTFSQTDLAGQAARYDERFRSGESPRFLPRCAHNWSDDIRQAVEEMLAPTGGGGFPFAIDFVCPRCSAPVIICFEHVEVSMAYSRYRPLAVLSE